MPTEAALTLLTSASKTNAALDGKVDVFAFFKVHLSQMRLNTPVQGRAPTTVRNGSSDCGQKTAGKKVGSNAKLCSDVAAFLEA